jgi:hypothetical protein
MAIGAGGEVQQAIEEVEEDLLEGFGELAKLQQKGLFEVGRGHGRLGEFNEVGGCGFRGMSRSVARGSVG